MDEPLTLDRTLNIVSQLAAAMSHAHGRGVVHLDLKPENIIVLPHDRVMLVDWGAARLYASRQRRRGWSMPKSSRIS